MWSAGLSPFQFGNPFAYLTAQQFAGALQAKLPPGAALAGVNAADLMVGAGQAFADLHADAAQLSEQELYPATTNVLLPFWEQDYGLPDCCTPLGSTLQQRRNTLQAKIAQVGGQRDAYYRAIAAALGWTITITRGAVGSFTWTINASALSPPSVFRVGENRAGDLLETLGNNTQLECVMNQIKPAHSILIFNYT
jgi:uncharacterized protein YmfQ (DUF2313 family)